MLSLEMPICAATETTKTACTDLIHACDKALVGKDKQISIRDLRIKQDEDHIVVLENEKAQLEKSSGAWYNSKILWLLIGAGATAYLLKK